MKNMNKITGLLRTSALCLTLAVMTACDAEDFTRTAGDIPGKDDLANVGGVLRREKTPEQISALKLGEGQTTTDAVFYQLTQPAAVDVTVTVDADAALVDEYNKDKQGDAKLTLFPVEKVTFEGGKTLTVKRGEKTSPALTVTLSREGVEKGVYLLPLRATVANNDMSLSEKYQIIYYRVLVGEIVPETLLDAYAFKVVGYVNTEEMNPLMGNQFYVTTFDDDFNEITKTWLDIEILRPAAIKFDKTTQRAMLDIGPDLQYVLSNRDKYIVPLQKASRKTLICITGGNTGLGFCNITDAQITDFLFQLKYVVETYKLDGVNYFDIEASYGKDGMPAVNPASYAKLIKATKEALGDDKLVTVACDAESTDLLASAQDGIEAGRYIDYAWSGIFDEVVDAYAEGAKLKPIAGLEQSKYGGALLKTNDTAKKAELSPILIPALKSIYRETQSGNIFAFWDMPTSSAGYEKGPVDMFDILSEAITDWDFEYDGVIFIMEMTPEFRGYGKFTKDW